MNVISDVIKKKKRNREKRDESEMEEEVNEHNFQF